ncbi:MAG: hypothetical protein FWG56_02580 [Desulfovibrionaceae bacterium]|jgi:hypothetical protein|nr:hypothetical protein [Desulfovibrionaceae bacterium]
MSCALLLRPRQIGFGWLLGLLLALPLAQSMAVWHAVSHLGGPGELGAQAKPAPRDGVPLPHNKVCELCLTAAAIDAGGLPAMAMTLSFAAPDAQACVPAPEVAAWATPPAAAYRSRAPPRAAV